MSASLTYTPLNSGRSLPGGNRYAEALRNVFGEFPIVLHPDDITRAKLSALAAIETNERNPYVLLIDALDEYGAVQVDATY